MLLYDQFGNWLGIKDYTESTILHHFQVSVPYTPHFQPAMLYFDPYIPGQAEIEIAESSTKYNVEAGGNDLILPCTVTGSFNAATTVVRWKKTQPREKEAVAEAAEYDISHNAVLADENDDLYYGIQYNDDAADETLFHLVVKGIIAMFCICDVVDGADETLFHLVVKGIIAMFCICDVVDGADETLFHMVVKGIIAMFCICDVVDGADETLFHLVVKGIIAMFCICDVVDGADEEQSVQISKCWGSTQGDKNYVLKISKMQSPGNCCVITVS